MKSSRLNKHMRKLILRALEVKISKSKAAEQLWKDQDLLARKAWESAFTPDEKAVLLAHPEMFKAVTLVTVVNSDSNIYEQLNMKAPLPLPYARGGNSCGYGLHVNVEDPEIIEEVRQLKRRRLELESINDAHIAAARAVLEKASTVAALLKVWPELENILKELNIEVAQVPAQLPAVVEDLNAAFDLP